MPTTTAHFTRGVVVAVILAFVLRPITRPTFEIIEPLNPQDPLRLSSTTPRHVLVAGGGLAGLSAALELAERGFQVTVREAGDVLGGRLATRQVQVAKQTFAIEHGFHAWFENYHVFADIRKRLDINHFFRPWGAVQFIFKDPKYKPESLASSGPYPWNLVSIVLRSPNLRMIDAILSTRHVFDLLWFDHTSVWAKYDEESFPEWAAAKGVAKVFYDVLYAPSLSVTVNERQNISAAEMLTMNHIYFLSHPKADHREVTNEDYETAVLGPWEKRLVEMGVVIERGRRVGGLKFGETGIKVMEKEGKEGKDASFDYVVLATNLQGVKSILGSSSVSPPTALPCPSYITTTAALEQLKHQVSHLETAPSYKIFRAFFDKQLTGPYAQEIVLETPDSSPVNLIAQYHLLEKESADWAAKTGGSVIEFHLYTWEGGYEKEGGFDEGEEVHALWNFLRPTVCGHILPEMCSGNFSLMDGSIAHYDDFPSFKKGLFKYRPRSQTPRELGMTRLALAGDWLSTSFPSALMERAVATGREAANVILLEEGVRQVPVPVTSNYGPGLRVLAA
ncbi:hypothetical protein VYU27_007844 [Nannochloropsis oceanica]